MGQRGKPAKGLRNYSVKQSNYSVKHHFILTLAAQLLHPFTPLNKLLPHTYTILTPWQLNTYIILPPLDNLPPHSYIILTPPPLAAQLLQHFTPLAAQLLHHFTRSGQFTPHSYTILPPLATLLLHHFIPSEQNTPSFLHHFTPPPWQPNYYILLPL